MKHTLISTALLFSTYVHAETIPFDLSISGKNFDIDKPLEISDVGEGKTAINFNFNDKSGNTFNFDLKYKALPSNRSYPTNLDITVKDGLGNKLGYLFFANNGVSFLKQMGVFGLIVDVDGEPVDFRFVFDGNKKGELDTKDLSEERFVQDTLVPKFNFQMIRPVLLPQVSDGLRSVSYRLDNHPYMVNYTAKDIDNGLVEFQHNLYKQTAAGERLLERIYFHADSLDTMREAMYAGKYFDKTNGTFKLVFYPAMGQTSPK